MNERFPQEENQDKGHVPAYIFTKVWQEGNFLIPADKGLRVELRLRLEQYSRYGVMFLPENEETRKILLDRIAALEAYDRGSSK